MNRGIVRTLKIVAPLAVLTTAGLVALTMYWNRAPAPVQTPVITPTSVRVQEVTVRDVPLSVTSQGTVRPRTESQLVPEIAGRVTWVAPSFAEGGFFELGDVLVRIDPFDYQQAVVSSRSQLAQARLRLAQEEAEADVALREWDALGRGDPRALTLREPQLEDAHASVAGAEAGLERAKRDLERAEIVAPYAGRVRQKNVDIGQFVRVGDAVATIYAVDFAEVRLPLPDEQLAYLDLPLSYRGGSDQPQPRVTIRATFAGAAHEWQGRIVRTESEIDPVSRMVHAVAEVPNPYAPGSRPPLAVGMYVEAEIAGRTASNVAVVPRAALRSRDRVLIVDADDRLRFREVDILRATTDAIYVRHGLAEGDLVVVSPLDSPTEGMTVQVADAGADLQARRRGAAPARTDDTPASDTSSPPPDRGRPSESTPPDTANFDLDPGLSLDDQLAALRRQVANLGGTSAARPTRPPDAAPVTELAAASGATDFSLDPSLSYDERIAAVRRQVELSRARSAAAPTRPTPDASPTRPARAAAVTDRRAGAAGFDSEPSLSGNEQIAALRRQVELSRARSDAARARPAPDASPDRPAAAPPRVADTEAGTTTAGPDPTAETAARPTRPVGVVPRVAVPPFVNVTRNPADDWISVDLTEAVRGAIEDTGTTGVLVITALGAAHALETATARGAVWLVGGAYQLAGDQIRVTARVIDVAGGDLVRAVKVDGTVDELDRLMREMVAQVRAEVTVGENRPRTTAGAARVVRSPGALAVLPFEDLSPSRERTADLGAAITDVVATSLAELSVVTVVSADEGAAWVVGGGVQQIGGAVRVTARLIDVESGVVLTTVKVDGTIDALAELHARVASALSEGVREALSAQDAEADQGADAAVAGDVGTRS